MPFCQNEILALSSGIYEDLSSPTNISVAYISGWLVSSGNLGKVNNVLSSSFYVSGGSCIPDFGADEQAIYSEIYKIEYYKRSLQSNLGAGGVQWVTLKEGDSSITRASPTHIAAEYRQSIKESNAQLRLLIGDYKRNRSLPEQVVYADLPYYPTS